MRFKNKLTKQITNKLQRAESLEGFFTEFASFVGIRLQYMLRPLPDGSPTVIFFSDIFAGAVVEGAFELLAQKEFKAQVREIRLVSTEADLRVAKRVKELMGPSQVFLISGELWREEEDDLSSEEVEIPKRLWGECLIR